MSSGLGRAQDLRDRNLWMWSCTNSCYPLNFDGDRLQAAGLTMSSTSAERALDPRMLTRDCQRALGMSPGTAGARPVKGLSGQRSCRSPPAQGSPGVFAESARPSGPHAVHECREHHLSHPGTGVDLADRPLAHPARPAHLRHHCRRPRCAGPSAFRGGPPQLDSAGPVGQLGPSRLERRGERVEDRVVAGRGPAPGLDLRHARLQRRQHRGGVAATGLLLVNAGLVTLLAYGIATGLVYPAVMVPVASVVLEAMDADPDVARRRGGYVCSRELAVNGGRISAVVLLLVALALVPARDAVLVTVGAAALSQLAVAGLSAPVSARRVALAD